MRHDHLDKGDEKRVSEFCLLPHGLRTDILPLAATFA